MTLETLLTIFIVLFIGMIVFKAIRTILSFCMFLVLLYFCYYTFFTYTGAMKLSILTETFNIKSYRIKKDLITKDGKVTFDKPIEIGNYKVISTSCKTYKPVILCESDVIGGKKNG